MSIAAGAEAPAREVRHLTVQASAATAAAARAFVGETLRPWGVGPDTLDDALLVVSELVTNAFLHGRAAEVAIAVADRGDRIGLEVAHHEDVPVADPLTPLTVGADDTHGRGLAIVDVLSRTWGVEEVDGTRRVWAELAAARTGLMPAADRDPAVALLARTLAVASDVDAVSAAVTAWSGSHLATGFAGVAVAEADRTQLRYVSVAPLPEESAREWARFPVALSAPASDAFRTGRALFHESRSAVAAAYPGLATSLPATGLSAFAHLPLCHGAEAFGVLALGWDHGREVDADDRAWLGEVAALVAHGLLPHLPTRPTGP